MKGYSARREERCESHSEQPRRPRRSRWHGQPPWAAPPGARRPTPPTPRRRRPRPSRPRCPDRFLSGRHREDHRGRVQRRRRRRPRRPVGQRPAALHVLRAPPGPADRRSARHDRRCGVPCAGDARRRAGRIDQVRGARRARQADHPALDRAQPRRPSPTSARSARGWRSPSTARRPWRRAKPKALRTAPAPAPAMAVASTPLAAPAAGGQRSGGPRGLRRGARRDGPRPREASPSTRRADEVSVTLLGDGWFSPKDFVLANPPRIVVDLPGVKNEVRQRTIAVKGELVTRVRVSQFQTSPELRHARRRRSRAAGAHALVPDGERLAVVVGEGVTAAEAAPAPAPAVPAVAAAPETPATTEVAPSTTTLAADSPRRPPR